MNYFGFAPPSSPRRAAPGHRFRPSVAKEQKDEIAKCLKANNGATISQVAQLLDMEVGIVRIRLRVMENDGLARRTARKVLVTGSRHETVWELV